MGIRKLKRSWDLEIAILGSDAATLISHRPSKPRVVGNISHNHRVNKALGYKQATDKGHGLRWTFRLNGMRNWGLGFGSQGRWLGGALTMSALNVIGRWLGAHPTYTSGKWQCNH